MLGGCGEDVGRCALTRGLQVRKQWTVRSQVVYHYSAATSSSSLLKFYARCTSQAMPAIGAVPDPAYSR